MRDIKSRFSQNVKIDFQTCPVGGHNMHGKVERKIQEVKKLIQKTMLNEQLSVIQWETCAAEIANRINDLPLAIGNIVSDFGSKHIQRMARKLAPFTSTKHHASTKVV